MASHHQQAKPTDSRADLEGPNSFEQMLTEWQNIPDVKEFFENDMLEEGQSRAILTTSFGNSNTKVKAGLKIAKDLKVVESLDLIHKFDHEGDHGTKTVGLSLTEDQIKFQYDKGFRRSGNYIFNPFYKLSFFRAPFTFRKLTVGLNYGDEDKAMTHHELSLMEHQSEFKLRFRNSYMMTWYCLKLCSVGLASYGKSFESSTDNIISVHPHDKVKAYFVIRNLINKETSYDIGTKIDIDPKVAAYFNVNINPFLQYSWMAGLSFMTNRDVSGKVILNEFREANLHLTATIFKNYKADLLAKIPIERLNPAPPAWGFNLTVDF